MMQATTQEQLDTVQRHVLDLEARVSVLEQERDSRLTGEREACQAVNALADTSPA